ncbi:hypothetical protein [Streptomyces cavernae]|uniref:hypothetical protein n=1 Tax=Streptomyces cavernae TaxID=2259034 RepID=UPI000FEBC01C|nr:hypothetical protein [Streptomyces cavernae]
MTGQISLAAIVLLALGGVTVFIAYRNERLGAAILVGVGVVALLGVLLGAPEPAQSNGDRPVPSASVAPPTSPAGTPVTP